MANEHLREALNAKGLTIEDVSERLRVDRKTAERWVTHDGRKPHRPTRRKLAQLLSVDEVQLWPELSNDLHTKANSDNELVKLYPSRSALPVTLWNELINGVQQQMDVLVFSGQFLVEQHNLIPVMREKVQRGIQFRLLVGDEKSQTVIDRAAEEGTSGGLEGRVQMMRRYLSEAAGLPGVEVRTHSTILYNSLYRFDDKLLVNGHAFGALAGESPVLHLRRLPTGEMWQHYMKSFERVWERATPEPS